MGGSHGPERLVYHNKGRTREEQSERERERVSHQLIHNSVVSPWKQPGDSFFLFFNFIYKSVLTGPGPGLCRPGSRSLNKSNLSLLDSVKTWNVV